MRSITVQMLRSTSYSHIRVVCGDGEFASLPDPVRRQGFDRTCGAGRSNG